MLVGAAQRTYPPDGDELATEASMKWVLRVIAGLILVVLAIVAVGLMLPREHRATTTTIIRAPVDSVWKTIADVQTHAQWRDGVERVEIVSAGEPMRWREITDQGAMTLERVEASPPRRMVSRIADEDLPFGGTWTYELEPVDTGTQVRITEDGFVSNPIFRFMSRFVFGHHATQASYLRSLGRRFGHDVELATT
jgi:uncharacterized protein YndB with AHSA1/START domain